MKALLPISLAAACLLCSCDKAPQSSTTIVTNEDKGGQDEFASLAGTYDAGKLYIQYHVGETNTGSGSSEWTIHAPFEIKVLPSSLEIEFSGTYKVNGVNTDSGKKRLYIKKAFIHTILYSDSTTTS